MTERIKPSSTSAAITAFCAAKIEGPGGFLWIDGNGKITAGNGTLDEPKPNAFSLVQIEDCPFATTGCKTACYVHGLEKHAPETHALYRHNSQQIRAVISSADSQEWAILLGNWISENCKGGFRWHVSGDIFCADYAAWIGIVTRASWPVRHWIYTRSFPYVPVLMSEAGDNLTVNLSCDAENYSKALLCATEHGGRLCYLTTDGVVPIGMSDGSVIFPDYSLRGGTSEGQRWFADLSQQYKSFVCPVDYHGKAENRRCGPCDRCLKRPQVAAEFIKATQ